MPIENCLHIIYSLTCHVEPFNDGSNRALLTINGECEDCKTPFLFRGKTEMRSGYATVSDERKALTCTIEIPEGTTDEVEPTMEAILGRIHADFDKDTILYQVCDLKIRFGKYGEVKFIVPQGVSELEACTNVIHRNELRLVYDYDPKAFDNSKFQPSQNEKRLLPN